MIYYAITDELAASPVHINELYRSNGTLYWAWIWIHKCWDQRALDHQDMPSDRTTAEKIASAQICSSIEEVLALFPDDAWFKNHVLEHMI